MSCSVFTYGTLEIPDVMLAVTGKVYDSVEAMADGYARFLLKGRIYPGMTHSSGQVISGRVYFEVDDLSLALLDQFEDEIYLREWIPIQTVEGNCLNAYTYIIPPKDRGVLSADSWIREEFVARHLAAYIAVCRTFHLTTSRALDIQSADR